LSEIIIWDYPISENVVFHRFGRRTSITFAQRRQGGEIDFSIFYSFFSKIFCKTKKDLYFCGDSSSHASHKNSAPGEDFEFLYVLSCFVMEYTKKPLSIEEQINKLKQRGLIISDENIAAKYLSNISYYRLRAYTIPFQDFDNQTKQHIFRENDIKFDDIVDLYSFDSRLRTLIFNVLGKIEVALRAKLIYEYCAETEDSHWFLDKTLYFNVDKYDFLIEKIDDDVKRSNEDFVSHYQTTYTFPELPPAWMTLETLSFGNISKMIANLDCKSKPLRRISTSLGLSNPFILENWIYSFSVLRNFCAHHSRLWNRRFHVELKMPYNTIYPFIDKNDLSYIHTNKLFAVLSCIQYIIKIINPEIDFKKSLIKNISKGGKLLNIKDMGFPHDWQTFSVWD